MGINLIRKNWPEHDLLPDSVLLELFEENTLIMTNGYLKLFDEVIIFFIDWVKPEQLPMLRDQYKSKMRVRIWNDLVTIKDQLTEAKSNDLFEYSSNLITKVIALSLDNIINEITDGSSQVEGIKTHLEEIKSHFIKETALQLFDIDYDPILEVINNAETNFAVKKELGPNEAIISSVQFESYLTDEGKMKIPAIRKVINLHQEKGFKGGKIAMLLIALKELGYLNLTLDTTLPFSEVFNSFQCFIDGSIDIGVQEGFRKQYLIVLGNDNYKSRIDSYKRGINSNKL